MRKAYSRRFGQEIPVDVLEMVERTLKVLDGSRVHQISEDWKEMDRDLTYDIKVGDPSDLR